MTRARRKLARPALAASASVAAVVLVFVSVGVLFFSAAAGGSAHGEPLVAACVTMAGAGHAACRAPIGPRAAAAPDDARFGGADFAGVYSLYRLVGDTSGHRRCRLQPTCSLFAAQAARRFGIVRGLLMGLARAQMSHTGQDGLLGGAVASDGEMIFFDPVERWIHGAL